MASSTNQRSSRISSRVGTSFLAKVDHLPVQPLTNRAPFREPKRRRLLRVRRWLSSEASSKSIDGSRDILFPHAYHPSAMMTVHSHILILSPPKTVSSK